MSKSQIESTPHLLGAETGAPDLDISVTITRDANEIEKDWRAFENAHVLSPYQSYDWLSNWTRYIAPHVGLEPLFISVQIDQVIVARMPLAIERKFGLRIARWMADDLSNSNLPVMMGSFARSASQTDIRSILDHCSKAAGGVDLFHLVNQPEEWAGNPNPFTCLHGTRSPSPIMSTTLQPDYEAFAKATRSTRGLKRLNRSIRHLNEKHGPLTLKQAETPAEIDAAFAAFHSQRADRFAEQGIRNIFRDNGMDEFLRQQLKTSAHQGARSGAVLDYLAVGDHILATYIGLIQNQHYTCFSNSFDTHCDFEKFSPGNILLAHIIQTECQRGTKWFDIGVGEARYKSDWCEKQTLVDSIIPMSALGTGWALKNRAFNHAKRFIKGDERLWSLYKGARKRFAGRSDGA